MCQTVTTVPPRGAEMAYLVCGGCRTLLSYARGATSVQCSECSTVNLAIQTHQIAHVTCGGCNVTLMYAQGATSVSCAQCHFVTSVAPAGGAAGNSGRGEGGNGAGGGNVGLSAGEGEGRGVTNIRTVVVQHPDTLDENGQLIHNIAVGVTSEGADGGA